MPPTFEDAVRRYLVDPWKKVYSPSTPPQSLIDSLEYAASLISEGRISTFHELAEMLSNPMIAPAGAESLDSSTIYDMCRNAEAMYKASKVSWVASLLHQIADPRVLSVETTGMNSRTQNKWPPDMTKASVPPDLDKGKAMLPPHSSPHTAPAMPAPPFKQIKKRKRGGSDGDSSPSPSKRTQTATIKCPHCTKTFCGTTSDRKQNLARHINTAHTPPGQGHGYSCDRCGLDFPRSDYRSNHMRKCGILPLSAGPSPP